MKAKITYILELLRTSFWFVPLIIVISAIGLSGLLTYIDSLVDYKPQGFFLYLYTGSAESARSILSTISAAMLGAASIVFSITLVALSLASSQFGPRLVRNFMYDRLNQTVLGTYIATFMYSLLVLQTVKGTEAEVQFIPHLAILFSLAISVCSIILLVIFIHHISVSIQADHIISTTANNLNKSLRKLFPEESEQNKPEPGRTEPQSFTINIKGIPLHSHADGYLQTTNTYGLIELAQKNDFYVKLHCRPGDYVVKDSVLATYYAAEPPRDNLLQNIYKNFILGKRRTPIKDPEFAINQIVEIACRALSPGINDPFTAITGIDKLTSAMCYLTKAHFPKPEKYDTEGVLRLTIRPFTFSGLLDASFNQIRQYGAPSPSVMIRLMEALFVIYGFASKKSDKDDILRHADMIFRTSQITFKETNDFFDLSNRYEKFERI
ncbi:MAG: DUF2254 domain-containing protein [Bacteroidales bacterium]|nr:DUF2254 domain-containing protein [Bacteroidales bacterium]